jgi:hypothetical protein
MAQTDQATITGTVTDPSGRRDAGASFVITSNDTGAARETKTNDAGIFTLTSLNTGNYNAREDIPTDSLISRPDPVFRVPQSKIGEHTKVTVFGDQRFTDPTNTAVTNPKIRQWLVQKIAAEHPDAILMNGDVPYSGDVKNDYVVYKSETKVWRDEHLNVFPALFPAFGNHEFHGDPNQALEHWWTAFPEMRNRRWYSTELGKSIYTITLDSDTSLAKGSKQLEWLNAQLMNLPKTTRFVFISLHPPPGGRFPDKN